MAYEQIYLLNSFSYFYIVQNYSQAIVQYFKKILIMFFLILYVPMNLILRLQLSCFA